MVLFEELLDKKSSVAVVGLGYVGLPLAVALSRHFDVIGFDINVARVEALTKGHDSTNEVDDASLAASSTRFTNDAAELGKAGVASLDLEPILQKTGPSGHDAFWRADYHWTAWAAEDAAQGAADLLRQRYPLTGEPGGGTALGPWVQKRMFGDLAANLLPAAKRKLIGRDAYTVRQEVEKDLLIDDAPAPVHVIGNSFVQPFLGFPQRLSNILDRPVTLTWNPGDIGPWATFMQYLESSDFAAQKPQVIIWQFNEGQLHLGPDASQWTARQPPSRSEWLQRLDKALQ